MMDLSSYLPRTYLVHILSLVASFFAILPLMPQELSSECPLRTFAFKIFQCYSLLYLHFFFSLMLFEVLFTREKKK